MTDPLFLTDPYARRADAVVQAVTGEGGIVVPASLFYPRGGGQPGDGGWLTHGAQRIAIADCLKGPDAQSVVLIPEDAATLPAIGDAVLLELDWPRRLAHMRCHTALHLLSVVIPLPVTGGQIGIGKGRLDFLMPDPPADVAGLEMALNGLIARDLDVTTDWITDAELAANPGLVKTMSVQPPAGQGRVRLVRIGLGDAQVDLQPCGGTHVARTSEIGPVRFGKIENKGRQNRRVGILLG